MLLIFPPQWTPLSPHFAIPSLIGQLKANGYDAYALDLNVEFYHNVLKKDYINFINYKIKQDHKDLFLKVKKIYNKNKKQDKYTLEEQCILYKYNKVNEFVSKDDKFKDNVSKIIEDAVEIVRSKEKFYQPKNLITAINVVDYALKMVSIAYSPLNIGFDNSYNPFLKLTFESIKHFVFDKESNIYWEFFSQNIEAIKGLNMDFIAISLNSTSQLVPALTLSYLLKKHTKAHINIGGNFFGRVKDEVLKHPEFSQFCDSITVEEGEKPILEMAKFINGEIKIEEVSNLIYFKNSKAYENSKTKPIKLNDMVNINLDDFDLKKYFTPYITMPYQTSKGCYWGKCTFCDQDFGQEFNVKQIEKVISEMKELKEKYNIEHFEFIDESVSPTYLKDFSKEILKSDIKPKFFCDARLETQFDNETFELASRAGLKMIMWGLESGSNKIMKSINKGIDLDKRFEILKNANENNIWNFAFIFFGFPLETQEDARETIDMLIENHKIINSYGRSVFTMGKHARIAQSQEEFGITKIHQNQEEFSPSIDFDCIGMNKDELSEILKECKEKCFNYYQNPLWMYLRYREWLFLYIDKFGVEWVSNYNIN